MNDKKDASALKDNLLSAEEIAFLLRPPAETASLSPLSAGQTTALATALTRRLQPLYPATVTVRRTAETPQKVPLLCIKLRAGGKTFSCLFEQSAAEALAAAAFGGVSSRGTRPLCGAAETLLCRVAFAVAEALAETCGYPAESVLAGSLEKTAAAEEKNILPLALDIGKTKATIFLTGEFPENQPPEKMTAEVYLVAANPFLTGEIRQWRPGMFVPLFGKQAPLAEVVAPGSRPTAAKIGKKGCRLAIKLT